MKATNCCWRSFWVGSLTIGGRESLLTALCYTELELTGEMVKGGEEMESGRRKRGHFGDKKEVGK